MDHVGSRIRELREEREVTQGGLARLSGISRTLMYQIEHGERNPSLTTLERIADALGTTPAEFFPPPPKKVSAPSGSVSGLRREEVERRRAAFEAENQWINEVLDRMDRVLRESITRDQQATARALESERPQTVFQSEAEDRLQRDLESLPKDVLAGQLREARKVQLMLQDRLEKGVEQGLSAVDIATSIQAAMRERAQRANR